jgi:peptide/nickel transport system ATP-binding protein
MLPDGGRICEKENPPWQQSAAGHRILCHIPLKDLEKIAPVVHTAA